MLRDQSRGRRRCPLALVSTIAAIQLLQILYSPSAFSYASAEPHRGSVAQKQQEQQGASAPSPQLFEASAEELWALCEHFPAMQRCAPLLPNYSQQQMISSGYGMHSANKRKSAYIRLGRSAGGDIESAVGEPMGVVDKRKSAYMRFGKRSSGRPLLAGESGEGSAWPNSAAGSVDKRKSAYMRFGKRKSAYMRFGKRSSDSSAAASASEGVAVN